MSAEGVEIFEEILHRKWKTTAHGVKYSQCPLSPSQDLQDFSLKKLQGTSLYIPPLQLDCISFLYLISEKKY